MHRPLRLRAARRSLGTRLCSAHHHDVLSRPLAAFAAGTGSMIDGKPDIAATLLVFFAIILLGGLLQALFGLLRLGSLIKFAPHPVMAGFQNMAAVLLFLVQLGNVLGFDHNVSFTRVFSVLGEARPLSVFVAVLTFAAMWNASRITTKVPPLLVGLGCGIVVYCGLRADWSWRSAWTYDRSAYCQRCDAHGAGRFFGPDDGRSPGAFAAGDSLGRTCPCRHRLDRRAVVREVGGPAG